MASPTDTPAAGDKAEPVLVRLAAGDVGARAPGWRVELLAVPSKGAAAILAVFLVAFTVVAVATKEMLPESAPRHVVAYVFGLLLRVLIALLAAGVFIVAFTLFVVVSFTVLSGRLRAAERHRFRWL